MPSSCAALLVVYGLSRLLDEGAASDGEDAGAVEWVEAAEAGPGDTAVTGLALPVAVSAAVRAAGAFDPPPGEPPIVTDFQDAVDGAAEVVDPGRRIWVRHRVRPRERLTQIAARYGTTAEEIAADNGLDERDPDLRRFRRIRVRARRLPPPRRKVTYVVSEGEGWGDVAANLRVERLDLHAWNWERRSLFEGRELVVWVDPGAAFTLRPGEGPPVPDEIDVESGAESVGRPQRGRLTGGVLLPKSDLYTRRHPTHGLWGSSHTLLQIQKAFATFRHDTGYEGEVVIGALSRRRGGRFHPHVSHQSGRDIDIRLPVLPGVPATDTPNPDEVDWYATWGLIDAFLATEEVSMIFLDVSLHRRLYEAARVLGETPEELALVLKWPTWSGRGRPLVRHSRGHDTHIHVRIECGPTERRCRRK